MDIEYAIREVPVSNPEDDNFCFYDWYHYINNRTPSYDLQEYYTDRNNIRHERVIP